MLSECNKTPPKELTMSKFEIDQSLMPFKSRYLKLDSGAKIHYLDEGKGPVILLLHGNPTWSFLYRHIITGLKTGFRLIAPDYPGFGLSYAPENYAYTAKEHASAISEFVEKLDLNDMAIMVQDWGGPIGFHVALQHPQRVSKFIIGNTWAWPLERFGQKTFSVLMGGWPGQFCSWCCNYVVKFFMTRGLVKQLKKNEMLMYLAPFKQKSQRRQTHIFPKQLRKAETFLKNIYEKINSLSDRPTLIVWGEKDFAFQKPERNRFEFIFKNHKTVILENAGHFIQEDAPDKIIKAIRKFYN